MNNDIEGDIGEFIVEDNDELEDKEQFDELGDMLTTEDGVAAKLVATAPWFTTVFLLSCNMV